MDRIILYHGSERIIEKPLFGKKSYNSDYGDAFYCTTELYSAKEWANKRTTNGVVNKYSFDGRGLKILDLTDLSKWSPLHWFAILIHNRELEPSFIADHPRELEYLEKYYNELCVEEYDVIIGYRADDSYFTFPLYVINGDIRLERIESVIKLGFLGKQVAIVSKKAFGRLSFVKHLSVEPIYYEKYQNRVNSAKSKLLEIVRDERYKTGTRLNELVRNND